MFLNLQYANFYKDNQICIIMQYNYLYLESRYNGNEFVSNEKCLKTSIYDFQKQLKLYSISARSEECILWFRVLITQSTPSGLSNGRLEYVVYKSVVQYILEHAVLFRLRINRRQWQRSVRIEMSTQSLTCRSKNCLTLLSARRLLLKINI